MAISTNAQKVQKVYRGAKKVFQDDSSKLIDIELSSLFSGFAAIKIDKNDSTKGYLFGIVEYTNFPAGLKHGDVIGTIKSSRNVSNVSLEIYPGNGNAGNISLVSISNNIISVQQDGTSSDRYLLGYSPTGKPGVSVSNVTIL